MTNFIRQHFGVEITLLLIMMWEGAALAQNSVDNETVVKSFVVVKMDSRYSDAVRDAHEAAKRLRLSLNLRGLSYNRQIGLTLSKAECNSNDWEYPSNYPRGRFDDGNYVSIEWSTAFGSLKRGKYVVVVASGENDKSWLRSTLTGARKVYADAFITRSRVYLGCLH